MHAARSKAQREGREGTQAWEEEEEEEEGAMKGQQEGGAHTQARDTMTQTCECPRNGFLLQSRARKRSRVLPPKGVYAD